MKESVEYRLRALADYLLLNACALSSSGLMQGRAGIALSLFETADLLHDAYLEEQAFDLLRQALLTRTEQIDMPSGLGGIGYALLYVIKGRLLEADFEDLFGNRSHLIETQMNQKLCDTAYDGFDLLDLALFWHVQERTEADRARNKLLVAAETWLEQWFDALSVRETRGLPVKAVVLSRWTHYLRVAAACGMYRPPVGLLERYMDLYRADCFRNEWETGYWLGVLTERVTLPGLADIAARNRETGSWDGMNEEQSFPEYMRCLYLQSHDAGCGQAVREQIKTDYLETSQEELETRLGRWKVVRPGMVGLYGVARLLLLLCAVCRTGERSADRRIRMIMGNL